MLQAKINGMSCGHCSSSVTKEFEENGATNVKVDLNSGIVTWEGDLSVEKAKELAEDLGFNADPFFK